LLDEFEHDISGALLRRDMSAVMAHCQTYARRFRALSEEKDCPPAQRLQQLRR